MLAIEKSLIHWRSTNINSGNENPSAADIYRITLDMNPGSDLEKAVNASYEKYKQQENTNQLLNKNKEKFYLDQFETDLKTELGIALANKEKNEANQKEEQDKLDHERNKKLNSAKQVNEQLKKEMSCKNCSKNVPNNVVFIPCGHLACKSCSTQLEICNICNKKIKKNLPSFWPDRMHMDLF
ncbi:MAG: hypothetical protein KAG53_00295 [Endozoicomonadaceae bacterium]|nr:hypothetical protein [Endozoicomonadaceae bacterium]